MFRNALFSLSLLLAVPALAIAQEKKNAASSKGAIDVFPDCSQVPGNLVRNCGFESGDFAGWMQSGDTSFTTVTMEAAHSGNFGAKIGPVGFPGFLSQSLTTIPGQLYNLSFWLRSSGQPNQFMLYWDGTPISNLQNFPNTPRVMENGGPQFDQFFFSLPPASGDSTLIAFGFFNPPDFFFFDDVVVVPLASGAQAN